MDNEIIMHYLKKIMVCMPVEIVSVDTETSLCTVKPLIFDSLEFPLIVKCPFLHIGVTDKNIKFKVKPKQRFWAMFSQLDLSNYISGAVTGQVNSKKGFSFTNCVILPVGASTEIDKINIPALDFEINGDIKINGNINLTGNIVQEGSITSTGLIHSDEDVTAKTVSLDNHIHKNTKPGNDTEFSGPPKQ